MINKILSIKNIGKFNSLVPIGDTSFQKLVLIYAENGQGKTTLCSILRSLHANNPSIIQERRTLGAANHEESSVQVLIDNKTIEFKKNNWSMPYPNIAIFDAAFIHENIYEGDSIDNDQRRRLYNVVIGGQGVILAKEIDKFTSLIDEENKEIRDNKKIIDVVLPSSMSIDTFILLQKYEKIEEKIKNKSEEIAKTTRAMEHINEIARKPLLKTIALPQLPDAFFQTLDCKLENIITDAERRVRSHILKHQMGANGEMWLSQGVSYTNRDACPFCGQDISSNELISIFRSFFNKTYKTQKDNVDGLSRIVSNAIGNVPIAERQEIISSNIALMEFWRQFAIISFPEVDFSIIRNKYKELEESANIIVRRKQQSPIDEIEYDESFINARGNVDALAQIFEEYNDGIISCNKIIEQKKKEMQSPGNVSQLKNDLARLEAQKKRYDNDIAMACQKYSEASARKKQYERDKENARKAMDDYCRNIFPIYESVVNEFLGVFNAGFRLVETKYDYMGKTPRTTFQIRINNNDVNIVNPKPDELKPTFRTTLSSGDKSALALAFFLSLLKQEGENLKEKIIIFDDPFNSQDQFRRTCTQQKIVSISSIAKQVIVFSHDPHFLKLIKDSYKKTHTKVLRINYNNHENHIMECDIDNEVSDIYYKSHWRLREFHERKEGDLMNVARTIRPYLEGWLRRHYPGRFGETEWLGDFLEKIRLASDDDGLSHSKQDLQELSEINDYAKKFHHSGMEDIPLIKEELFGFVKRTLRVTGGNV